jgi:hypothetical protein
MVSVELACGFLHEATDFDFIDYQTTKSAEHARDTAVESLFEAAIDDMVPYAMVCGFLRDLTTYKHVDCHTEKYAVDECDAAVDSLLNEAVMLDSDSDSDHDV